MCGSAHLGTHMGICVQHTLRVCSKHGGLGGLKVLKLYFEIVFLRLNCLKWQLFIWKRDCRLEGRRVHLELWEVPVGPRRLQRRLLHGFCQVFVVVCGLVVCFPSGVLWVLLFACSTHVSSREGAGQFCVNLDNK